MHRLFLDANVLFSAAYREDSPLMRLWHRRGVALLTSAYAQVEAERHLDESQRLRLKELINGVRLVPDAPSYDLPKELSLRGKDVPIVAAAMAAGATHLITGDRRDFGRYYGKRLGEVLVLPPRDYLARPERKPRRSAKK
ncbi:MAG: PIN domain-containing protein [Vicinamibacteria bacterium]